MNLSKKLANGLQVNVSLGMSMISRPMIIIEMNVMQASFMPMHNNSTFKILANMSLLSIQM